MKEVEDNKITNFSVAELVILLMLNKGHFDATPINLYIQHFTKIDHSDPGFLVKIRTIYYYEPIGEFRLLVDCSNYFLREELYKETDLIDRIFQINFES